MYPSVKREEGQDQCCESKKCQNGILLGADDVYLLSSLFPHFTLRPLLVRRRGPQLLVQVSHLRDSEHPHDRCPNRDDPSRKVGIVVGEEHLDRRWFEPDRQNEQELPNQDQRPRRSLFPHVSEHLVFLVAENSHSDERGDEDEREGDVGDVDAGSETGEW